MADQIGFDFAQLDAEPPQLYLIVRTAQIFDDVILTIALFATMSHVASQGSGVTPAIGFYIGMDGLVASVAGTVMAQTVLRHK